MKTNTSITTTTNATTYLTNGVTTHSRALTSLRVTSTADYPALNISIFFISAYFKSSFITSQHRFFGLPFVCFASTWLSKIFFSPLSWSILVTWPSQQSRIIFTYVTKFSSLSRMYSSRLYFILSCPFSIFVGPKILPSIFLSKYPSSFCLFLGVSSIHRRTSL